MKKKLFYISIFIFFVIILCLSPISGDDWGNYLEGSQGLRHSITQAIGMYFTWEGRFISRVLINLLTYHKVIWNIINSLAITSIIFLFIKLLNPKHKKTIYLLSLLVILSMNIFTFSQVVVWVAGNITYLFVIPLLLSYFYYIFYKKKSRLFIILFSILNFIIPMFIEHMAIILVISNIIFILYRYIVNKKLDRELVIYLILSLISTSIMLLSPGTKFRSGMENVSFNELSIINKIIYNIPNFINYTFIINYFLTILMIIVNYYLITKNSKNKLIKYILLLFMSIIPILSCSNYLLNSLKISSFDLFINCNNILINLYYIIYMIIMFYFIFIDTKKDKDKKVLFFFIIGILSNVVMMVSPTWGYRTSFSTYIFLAISMLMIIDKYIKEKKIYNCVLCSICTLFLLFYLVLYISVHLQYNDNLRRIIKGRNNKSKSIEIVEYPYFVNCNINPSDDFHLVRYKKYYKINKNVEIILKENNWKYLIFYKNN